MLTLIQFPPAGGLPNLSPFCLKLETWLRIAGLEYRNRYTPNPGKGPLGKLPAIELNGKLIPDSNLCIQALKKQFGVDPDAALSAEQKAVAHAFRVLFEDHLYWTVFYSRWFDERYWPQTRAAFFGSLPPGLNRLVPVLVQRAMRKEIDGHGMGRYAPEQIYRFAGEGLSSIAVFLGDKSYFMGSEPSDIDAVAYGFLAQLTLSALDSPLKVSVQQYPNIVAYCERMRSRYYPA